MTLKDKRININPCNCGFCKDAIVDGYQEVDVAQAVKKLVDGCESDMYFSDTALRILKREININFGEFAQKSQTKEEKE